MGIDELPDSALVPLGWVREHFVPKANAANRDMTARECSIEFGHSRDWWQDRARKGEITGAYQGGVRARWYIPRESATVFLREQREASTRKRKHRTPWKGPRRTEAA